MVNVQSMENLQRLSKLYGIQTSYHDAGGQHRVANSDGVLAVLRSLGAPVQSLDDVDAALHARVASLWMRRAEPVVVDWVGQVTTVVMRLPAEQSLGSVNSFLRLEDGTGREWTFDLSGTADEAVHEVDGQSFVQKRMPLPAGLPWGYHRLTLQFEDSQRSNVTVITAPQEAFTGQRGASRRLWGAFLPLYAVHHVEGMGFGTYSDLETLVSWIRDLGGDMFGTLPLLPTFLDEPFEPSPYSPVSRRFWSEFYIDLGLIPELDSSTTAQAMLLARDVQEEIERLRSERLVDYRSAAALKRKLLAELGNVLAAEAGDRHAAFKAWCADNPLAIEYSRFMAVVDRQQTTWQEWSESLQNGVIADTNFNQADADYHLYVQWLAEQQLSLIAGEPGSGGSGLYLDLPLGVHPGGFDVWRDRDVFAVGARVGAPPDLLNQDGQDWGFPPMHPDWVREDGYDYFRQCIRHHLRHAGALRIDHVMGLHRLYWIPEDATPQDGIYVEYRADELYAILTLESHRSQALIIGEDLGTVPDEVRTSMTRHQFQRMYVVPFQIGGEHEDALRPVDDGSLATMNTHDLPPFATTWAELDQNEKDRIADFLHERGWLETVSNDGQSVLGALTRYIASSPASMVLVNLEDLWLETEQQNVPGTIDEHPNWRRKARYDLDAFTRMPRVTDALRELDLLRKRGR